MKAEIGKLKSIFTAVLLAFCFQLSAFKFVFAAVQNPDTFIYATIGDVDSLDPAWSYDTASHHIIAQCYEFLFAYKGESTKDMEGRLAAQVPSKANGLVSADGLTLTVPLRKGVKFHSGAVMTPEDVRYSLIRFMLLDRDGGPSSLLLEPLLGVVTTRGKDGKMLPGLYKDASAAITVKGDAVVFKLKKPFAPFLTILADFGGVVEKAFVVKNGGWDGSEAGVAAMNNPPKRDDLYLTDHVNGTGPYKLERWDKTTAEIVLVAFDGYWRGKARLNRVITKKIDDFNLRKLKLQNGDADSIYAPQMFFNQVANLPGVEVVDGLETLESPTALAFSFGINPVGNSNIGSGKLDGDGIPPDFFSDIEVRKGFANAIDADAYIRDVQRGKGKRASGFIPKGMLGYVDDPKKIYPFDLKASETHFKKAWGGKVWDKGFKFTIIFNSGSQGMQILANMIKKNVENLNGKFKIDVRPMQWSTYLSETQAHKVPLEAALWLADYPDPHNFAFPIIHSQGYYSSKTNYKNPKADALVEKAVGELDSVKRTALYKELQDIVFDDVPFVNISVGTRYRAQRKWVKGWKFSPVFPDSPYGSYYYDLYKAE